MEISQNPLQDYVTLTHSNLRIEVGLSQTLA